FSIIILLSLFSFAGRTQHKVVWDMSLGDTAAQRGLYKQLNNVLTASPGIQIEVVFHSKAVYAMLKDTGYFKSQILDLHNKGIVFAVCNNSLKARNIDVGRVIPEAVVVPAAIIEIIKKQEEHWSYIKAGN
ncbi:MAG TPA: DsrE family protein, partial [Ferruginibacter sp.]|nr:DsrE family protein [Ferruginibacter sp.]